MIYWTFVGIWLIVALISSIYVDWKYDIGDWGDEPNKGKMYRHEIIASCSVWPVVLLLYVIVWLGTLILGGLKMMLYKTFGYFRRTFKKK